jgi:hypothetical protein
MQGLVIGFAAFVAFMLYLIDSRLNAILSVLNELRDYFISDDEQDESHSGQ